MSAAGPDYVIFLSSDKEPFEDSYILMILRNMAGQNLYLAVKRTATVWDVRHLVAIQMDLISSEIHLALDYKKLNDLDRIYTIQPLLEAKGNMVDILIDIEELPSLCFNCPNCGRECNPTECVEWSNDLSESCIHTTHYCCYGQWNNDA